MCDSASITMKRSWGIFPRSDTHSQMITYKNVTIYYLSGTGNTFRVATWFHNFVTARGIGSILRPIELSNPDKEVHETEHQLISLFLPTHGFTAPWEMIKFSLKIPRKKGAHAFCAATRGATKFGSRSFPGMAGTAALLIGIILFFKGYHLKGITGIDMPSNWMSLYSGFSTENSGEKIKQGKQKANGIFHHILEGRSNWFTWSNCWDLLIWGLPLIWLSIGYLLIARFFLAKLFFANNKCTGCGTCVKICPTNAVKMVGKQKPRPYWK